MKKIFTLFEAGFQNHLSSLFEVSDLRVRYGLDVFASTDDLVHLDIEEYNVLFIYVNKKRISDSYFSRITQFVRDGGNILALHSTFASFNNQESFLDVFGAKFIRHGPIRKFTVKPFISQNSIMKDIHEFEITDELFRQKYHPEIEKVFIYEGRSVIEPVVWAKRYGKGRTIGISLCHKPETMRNENIESIISRSMAVLYNTNT
jgi:type 1 glutamine amidotransferase